VIIRLSCTICNKTGLTVCHFCHKWRYSDYVINGRFRNNKWKLILKFASDFTLLLKWNVMIAYRLRYNELSLLDGNDVRAISPSGGATINFRMRILQGWPRFYLSLIFSWYVQAHSKNSTPILCPVFHCLSLLSYSCHKDVIVISSLGGASGNS